MTSVQLRFSGKVRELEHILERGVAMDHRESFTRQPVSFPVQAQTQDSSPSTHPYSAQEWTLTGACRNGKENAPQALQQKNGQGKASQLLGITFRSFRYRL